MCTSSRVRFCFALTLTAAVLTGGVRATAPAGAVSLGVDGRSNATAWVAASGSFVAVAWGAGAAGKTDVFVAVSRDAGQTFGTPVQVNTIPAEARLGGELAPRVALAANRGRRDPDVIVLWTARGDATTIKSSRSRNGGATFDAPVSLQASGAAGDRGWPALAVDPQGTAHAIWLDHRGHAAAKAAGTAHRGHMSNDGVAMARNSSLFYASAGRATTAEREITKNVCYCCKTALAAGPDGTVYAAWRHVYAGNFRDIAFTMTRDRGKSFAPPVRISEDAWSINGCPDDGPAMAVDRRGRVHVAWPTMITGEKPQGAIFYASTRDGRTFTKRIQVPTLGGPKPTHPQIAIDRDGRVVVAWEETIGGRRTGAAREIRLQDETATFGNIVTLAPEAPAIYPMLAATSQGLVAAWTTGGESSRVMVKAIALP